MQAYDVQQLSEGGISGIGGKAKGLLLLEQAGVPVPPWRLIPAEAARAMQDSADVHGLWGELASENFAGLAVRSSADVEDSFAHSWAGQFETVFVDAPQDLASAIRNVANSGPKAGREAPHRVSVIVQARVNARVSGVLFSAHPAHARPDTAYLETVFGDARGLVNGARKPSRFDIDLNTGSIQKSEPGHDGPDFLEPALVSALLEPLFRLERHFGAPLDIEWAADAARVWFLQARPITALQPDPALRPSSCATSWFFDQRFAEPIHPITRTTLLPLIARVSIGEALKMRGHDTAGPLVGFYGGQAYVPHETYRKMLAGAPRWWLTPDLRQLFPNACACAQEHRPRASMWNYAWCSLRSVLREWGSVFRNIAVWDAFRNMLTERLPSLEAVPVNTGREWLDRWHALETMNEDFLRIHRWSYLWANYLYRAVMTLLRLFPRPVRERCINELHRRAAACSRAANDALCRFLQDPDDAALEHFAANFGHRSESLDYAIPTWGELARTGALRQRYGSVEPMSPPVHESQPPGNSWLRRLLQPAARLLEMREEQRFEWERILAAQRRLLLHAAKDLAANGLISTEDDIWFLEWEELATMMERRHRAPEDVIARRRHEFYMERLTEKPLFIGPGTIPAPETSLHGIGASAGTAQGMVLVLRHFNDIPETLPEPVIGVFVCLDPAWTPVLPRFHGLIVERGGVLSHAAILAREYRIPMVIGAEGATACLHNGMKMSLDGQTGQMTAVSPEEQ